MAIRTFLFIISLLYLVNFTNSFSLQHVMARLNILETKFDMENKLMRSDIEELFRKVSEISTNGKMTTSSEHVSRDASSGYAEHVSPKELVAHLDRTTILPYTDMNKTTASAHELCKLKSYLIEGAKVEKDKNLKLRTELKGISNMLKTNFTMLESNIKEEIRNLTNHFSENKKSLETDYTSFKSKIKEETINLSNHLSKNQKSLEIDYANFKSNIEAEINNLTDHLSKNQKSQNIDYASFKSNIREDINDFKGYISQNQTSLVSLERFDNFKDFVTTALSIASNESRRAIISLKSDFEMSINEISNNVSNLSKTLANIYNRQTDIGMAMQEFSNSLSSMNKTLTNITDIISELKSTTQEPVHSPPKTMRSCQNSPHSGIYDIYLDEQSVSSVRVYCDQTTDGGGWIIFQRRQDGSVDFERTWADYKTGFGNLTGEFWLGNDNLHALTSSGFNELRIDLEDFKGNKVYAKYSYFKVKSESEKYELEVRGYSGDAGDTLDWHNGMSFSTKDRDNDKSSDSCSLEYRGAWWYNACHRSNLNGFYYGGDNSPPSKGVIWVHWRGWNYSL